MTFVAGDAYRGIFDARGARDLPIRFAEPLTVDDPWVWDAQVAVVKGTGSRCRVEIHDRRHVTFGRVIARGFGVPEWVVARVIATGSRRHCNPIARRWNEAHRG